MATAAQLAEQLFSGDAVAKGEAAETLASMAEEAAGAAAGLVAFCDDPSIGANCVAALESLGPPPADQLGRIADSLASPSGNVAYWAATLLGRAGEPAATHADALLALALNSAGAVAARERAAWALAKTGFGGVDPTPLEAVAGDATQPRLSRLATAALGR